MAAKNPDLMTCTSPMYIQWATVFQIRRAPCRGIECTSRAALRADASAEPARNSWPPALGVGFASTPKSLRAGSAPWLRACTPPALRAGSAELLAATSASRCLLQSTVLVCPNVWRSAWMQITRGPRARWTTRNVRAYRCCQKFQVGALASKTHWCCAAACLAPVRAL